ncbi:MAG TPA: NACHT domain-containing protein [Vicinamibacterales bacterium]|nr:NACHT domain-containing protein [Vicinamibacterales bacterium]
MGFISPLPDLLPHMVDEIFKKDVAVGSVLLELSYQNRLNADVVARLPRVLIVGEGGAGKSTLLRQLLARAAAAGNVPAWVSLSALPADGPLTVHVLIDYLVREAQSRLGVDDVNRQFFESLIASGQLAVGFDALDECATRPQRQRVRGLLVEVAQQWRDCQIFVTSRPEALQDTPLPSAVPVGQPDTDSFIAVTPLPFERHDVAPFLRVAFDDEGETLARELLGRTGLEALIATPLTLTLVGLVARAAKGLPATRTPLFARCLETVCETWEAAKGPQPLPDGLDPLQRLDVLRRLGWAAQIAGGDALDADQAGAAIATATDPAIAGRAERILSGLARRNLLLRAETAGDGSYELRSIRFSHPQFREYLGGAYLANLFARDAAAAASAAAPYWLDSRWLDVLRFAVATVEDRPVPRDAMLRAALAADDPYRELLHRPGFLVARLLARLAGADAVIVSQTTTALETAAREPALSESAADALLELGRHQAARPAIARFARGEGVGLAFPLDESQPRAERLRALGWRLRAIDVQGRTAGNAAALASLGTLPSLGLAGDLDCCLMRARLGDTRKAEAGFRQLFDAADDIDRSAIARAMDDAGLGDRFNEWLAAIVDAADANVARAQLALARRVIRDDAPVWTTLFDRAALVLAQLPAAERHAPKEVADAVYAACGLEPATGMSKAARLLVEAGLRHPSLLWYVGPRVFALAPDLAPEAVRRMTEYVLDAGNGYRPDWSQLNIAVNAICSVPDDALAVPALLELLRASELSDSRTSQIMNALRARGRVTEAFDMLIALLNQPDAERRPGTGIVHRDSHHMRVVRWALAGELDRVRLRALLDARFRSGEPAEDARQLMRTWDAEGLDYVARDWFETIAEDKSDSRAQEFLRTFTTHERDTAFTDFARQALWGGVFDSDPEPPAVPWTADDYERAFDHALDTGSYVDERDNEESATPRGLAWLLSMAAAESDPGLVIARADRWVQKEANRDGTDRERAEALAEVLDALSSVGLRNAAWTELAAQLARRLPPADRSALLTWLLANA